MKTSSQRITALRNALRNLMNRAAYACAHRYGATDPVGTRLIAIEDLRAEIDRASLALKESRQTYGFKISDLRSVGYEDRARKRIARQAFVEANLHQSDLVIAQEIRPLYSPKTAAVDIRHFVAAMRKRLSQKTHPTHRGQLEL